MKYLLFLGLALTGCKQAPVQSFGGEALRAFAPPPSNITYEQVAVADGLRLPLRAMEAVWTGPTIIDGRMVYDVVEAERREAEWMVRERLRVFYGAEGYGYLGTLEESGALEPWTPPQMVLPPNPVVGEKWTMDHVKGERTSHRSCELARSEFCEGGVVSICDSEMKEGRVVLRDHFCPGVGHVGFEALVVRPEQPHLRMWSRNLVRDGIEVGPREEDELLAP